MGFIGKNRGKAIKTGGAGGSFSRADLAWLGINRTLVGDPGVAGHGGHTASGGVENDYTTPTGDIYRTHTFTGSGTFQITQLSENYPAAVDYLAVGGGGGGSTSPTHAAGGGGGGGIQYRTAQPVTATSYTIIVGGGGVGLSEDPGTLGEGGMTSISIGTVGEAGGTGVARGGGGGGKYGGYSGGNGASSNM